MSYQATVYNVMIASPSDVAAERSAVRTVLHEWNVVHSESRRVVLLPIGWETHATPEMGEHPQRILNKQILTRSDLLVAVFWTRLGTPTEGYASGSVEEIEEHIAARKPAMLYFSNQPVRPDSVNSQQYADLVAFKNSCRDRGLLEEYENVADFTNKFHRQLQLKLNADQYFQRGGSEDVDFSIVGPTPGPSVSLSKEAQLLLKEATESDGMIMKFSYIGGTSVGISNRNFVEGNDRREIALWEAAVDELENHGLIEDKAGRREIYFVTSAGYKFADRLPSTRSSA